VIPVLGPDGELGAAGQPTGELTGAGLTLGIDPGTAICGYGLVMEAGVELRLLTFGVIVTRPEQPMPERLRHIHGELAELIVRYRPADVAVEQLFFNKNVRTALQVGQARGVVLLAAAQNDLPVAEYTPLQVKQAIVGYGRAEKRQVQEMVRLMLRMPDIPRPDDAADALAVAICHLHSRRVARRLA
jgi:crossover junction endodeoxyribonuclease RuvC